MLPYVEKTFRPERDLEGWEIPFRAKTALYSVAQLTAGLADGLLGIVCLPLALVSHLGEYDWTSIEKSSIEGLPTLNKTFPRAYKSFIRALHPNSYCDSRVNFLQLPYLTENVTCEMIKKVQELGKTKDNALVSQGLSRLLALSTVVASVAILALDLVAGSVLAIASFFTLGKYEKINDLAYNNLFLGIGNHPAVIVIPVSLTIKPDLML